MTMIEFLLGVLFYLISRPIYLFVLGFFAEKIKEKEMGPPDFLAVMFCIPLLGDVIFTIFIIYPFLWVVYKIALLIVGFGAATQNKIRENMNSLYPNSENR